MELELHSGYMKIPLGSYCCMQEDQLFSYVRLAGFPRVEVDGVLFDCAILAKGISSSSLSENRSALSFVSICLLNMRFSSDSSSDK